MLIQTSLVTPIIGDFCEGLMSEICSDVIDLLAGFNINNYNMSTMAVMASHEPGGTSL